MAAGFVFKSLLQLPGFTSSGLSAGMLGIVMVTRPTTDASAVGRGRGCGQAWKDTAAKGLVFRGWQVGMGLGVQGWRWGRSWGRALPSHNVRLIGPNPLKPIVSPHLLLHNTAKPLDNAKRPQASVSGILLQFKAKCTSLAKCLRWPAHLPPSVRAAIWCRPGQGPQSTLCW